MHIDAPKPRRIAISLTPLIDVVFILLIFFMLASQFSQWQRVDMHLNSPSEIQQEDVKSVIVTVRQSGYSIDNQPLSPEGLTSQLNSFHAAHKNALILIDLDNSASTQSLVDLLSLLNTAKLTPFSLLQKEAE